MHGSEAQDSCAILKIWRLSFEKPHFQSFDEIIRHPVGKPFFLFEKSMKKKETLNRKKEKKGIKVPH